MAQNQPLILDVQHIGGANGIEDQTAALGQRLQQQMALGIVAQRLKVAHALHRIFDGFLIEDPAVIQGNIQIEPLSDQAAEHFQLHLAHDLHMDLL